MDLEKRLSLINGIAQEVVTQQELRELLEANNHPIAYDGFEPSGIAHLPVGVYRPLLIKDLLAAGVKLKLLIADSFAWINEKMAGDLEQIRSVGSYFVEVWKAAGVDMSKVQVVWHKEHFDDPEYWKKVMLIAKNHTEARTKRALQIAGRKENEVKQAAQLFYPSMQAADIFQLECDIAQLGLDQRKANMLAREVAEKLGWKKPVSACHRMLLGLDGIKSASSADEETSIDQEIDAKMSKSKPETCIFVHDSREEIAKKINKAYCPAKVVEGNPLLEYTREIIFRAKPVMKIERPAKFGGDIEFDSYKALESAFVAGELHPTDLKTSVATELDSLIAPIRTHFQKNKKARQLYEQVSKGAITRLSFYMSDDKEKGEHGHGAAHGHAAAKSGGSEGGIMGFLSGLLNRIFSFLSESLRKFVAFSMMLFFLGTLFGYFIPTLTTKLGLPAPYLLVAPAILAVLAYYSTVVAAILFILLLAIFLIFL